MKINLKAWSVWPLDAKKEKNKKQQNKKPKKSKKNKAKQNSSHRTFDYKVPPVNLSVKITPPHIKFGQKRNLFLPHKCVFIYLKERVAQIGADIQRSQTSVIYFCCFFVLKCKKVTMSPWKKDSHSTWSITNLAITSKHKQSSPSNPDASSDTRFHELHSCFRFHYTHVVSWSK